MPEFGSLFSGAGLFDLALESSGLGSSAWHVETSEYCRKILSQHWPDVPNFEDVRDVGAHNLKPVPIIVGGFPCQNISSANVKTRAGLAGEKSGLWSEFRRIVSELRPRIVIVENAGNWKAWIQDVRWDLHREGYASLPIRLRAHHFGAPHGRDRCFVIADADGEGESLFAVYAKMARIFEVSGRVWDGRFPGSGSIRVGNGDSNRMDRLRAVGNGVDFRVGKFVGEVVKCLF